MIRFVLTVGASYLAPTENRGYVYFDDGFHA